MLSRWVSPESSLPGLHVTVSLGFHMASLCSWGKSRSFCRHTEEVEKEEQASYEKSVTREAPRHEGTDAASELPAATQPEGAGWSEGMQGRPQLLTEGRPQLPLLSPWVGRNAH